MARLFDPSLSNIPPAVDYERRSIPTKPRKTWWEQHQLKVAVFVGVSVLTYLGMYMVTAHGQTPANHPAVCGSEGFSMPEYHVTFLWKQPYGCGVKK